MTAIIDRTISFILAFVIKLFDNGGGLGTNPGTRYRHGIWGIIRDSSDQVARRAIVRVVFLPAGKSSKGKKSAEDVFRVDYPLWFEVQISEVMTKRKKQSIQQAG